MVSSPVTLLTTDPDYKAVQDYEKVEVVTDKKGATLKDVVDNKVTMGEFVAQMSLEELAKLNCGSGWGVANENAPYQKGREAGKGSGRKQALRDVLNVIHEKTSCISGEGV